MTRTYTPAQAAKHLQIGRDRLMRLIRSGEIAASNVGDGSRPRFRLTAEAISDWLERRRVRPAASKGKHSRITRRTTQEFF